MKLEIQKRYCLYCLFLDLKYKVKKTFDYTNQSLKFLKQQRSEINYSISYCCLNIFQSMYSGMFLQIWCANTSIHVCKFTLLTLTCKCTLLALTIAFFLIRSVVQVHSSSSNMQMYLSNVGVQTFF